MIGKIANYITWKSKKNDVFIITVLNNPFGDLLDKTYKNRKIKGKKVQIKYISNMKELGETDILYIASSDKSKLDNIIKNVKNVLTISSIRGFAQKSGIIQIYFASQRMKLKINLGEATANNLSIKSSLLRIATIVKSVHS